MRLRRTGVGVLIAAAMVSGGCQGYALRGKVVDGSASDVSVVSADDPRLAMPGISSAMVELTLDPLTLGRKVLAIEPVGADGTFAIPVGQFGAGTLEYEVGLVVRQRGYIAAEGIFKLPGGGRRVLVTLRRGRDIYKPPDDPVREAEPFLRP